jgi:hypothetical protein
MAEARNVTAAKIIAEYKVIPKQPKNSLVSMCNFSAEDSHIPIHHFGDQA